MSTATDFCATHRITFTPVNCKPQVFEVMESGGPSDDGSPLYTQQEWDATDAADWEIDNEGYVRFQGGVAPSNGTVTVEEI